MNEALSKMVRLLLVGAAASALGLLLTGCKRDARLAGRNIPENVQVRPVTHYGQALDEIASPEQVAYVLLRAVADDFRADSPEAREAALAVQFDICAADEIEKSKSPSRLRDEHIYSVVYHWTPTISHYVPEFPEGWDEAKARFVRGDCGEKRCEVLLEVDDPATMRDGKPDPNARVVMVVWMVKERGMWRVTHPGFVQGAHSSARRRILHVDANKNAAKKVDPASNHPAGG